MSERCWVVPGESFQSGLLEFEDGLRMRKRGDERV